MGREVTGLVVRLMSRSSGWRRGRGGRRALSGIQCASEPTTQQCVRADSTTDARSGQRSSVAGGMASSTPPACPKAYPAKPSDPTSQDEVRCISRLPFDHIHPLSKHVYCHNSRTSYIRDVAIPSHAARTSRRGVRVVDPYSSVLAWARFRGEIARGAAKQISTSTSSSKLCPNR